MHVQQPTAKPPDLMGGIYMHDDEVSLHSYGLPHNMLQIIDHELNNHNNNTDIYTCTYNNVGDLQ